MSTHRPVDDDLLPVLDARGVERPVSHRRPLEHQMPRTWFLRTAEFRLYAVRELSSLVVGLFVIHLCGAIIALHLGESAWATWLDLQRHPVTIAVTVFVLLMALLGAVTWYAVTPKIVKVKLGTRWLNKVWIIGAQYVAAIAVLVALVLWLGVAR